MNNSCYPTDCKIVTLYFTIIEIKFFIISDAINDITIEYNIPYKLQVHWMIE